MMPHPLDNPVWASLTSHHAGLARSSGCAKRYPSDVAPFVGIASGPGDDGTLADVRSLVDPGKLVCFVGAVPRLGPDWRIEHFAPIAQMVRDDPLDVFDGPQAIELASDDRIADMLALTALVYPHYFRPRTVAMGRYFGIYDGNRLAAMAGERMHCEGHREISAVCTHPDFLGRGHARRLIALLTNRILGAGEQPFLHFSHENTRAKALYERLGFAFRRDIPLLVAMRPAEG
ncbi:MAG TPA: GNAT family N-acetyltransferase [Rhodanobacteraceae bacterium]|nr:GNAT family N-acetyltransferase [Rhodanobacteraceae bacterium]